MTENERKQKSPDLYEQLSAYGASDFYPFHMPGHKRNFHLLGDPYAIDITEIDGFDNLHHAERYSGGKEEPHSCTVREPLSVNGSMGIFPQAENAGRRF
ncbi:MAG: hypothetical protein ACLU3N_06585 [Lachnospiraceae bacterium]